MTDTKPHVTRMLEEQREVLDRFSRLAMFLTTPTFADLDEEDRRLLVEQGDHMANYLTVLNERILRALRK